ncbi:transposase [Micromonospora sp. B11E3]|uniref:IS66 family transposase n=1 Tax=Micromonospora sp. B11E3 TaxID=3153562 RepID=UPI00325F8AC3
MVSRSRRRGRLGGRLGPGRASSRVRRVRRCRWWTIRTRWWSIVRPGVVAVARLLLPPRWSGRYGGRCSSCRRSGCGCSSIVWCRAGTPGVGRSPPRPAPAQVAAPVQYGTSVAAVAVYLLVAHHIPVARTAQILADLLGAPVSTGWVAGLTERTATGLTGFAERLGACPIFCVTSYPV